MSGPFDHAADIGEKACGPAQVIGIDAHGALGSAS
jgi:hypothetical protein